MGVSHLMQKVGQLKIISAQVSKQKILMYKSAERKKITNESGRNVALLSCSCIV